MKALLALANKNREGLDDEKGAWRGHGKLRGASKHFGEVPEDETADSKRKAQPPPDDDSSTSSVI